VAAQREAVLLEDQAMDAALLRRNRLQNVLLVEAAQTADQVRANQVRLYVYK